MSVIVRLASDLSLQKEALNKQQTELEAASSPILGGSQRLPLGLS